MTLDTMPGPLCCVAAPLAARGMKLPLPALNDEEGPRLPSLLPPVVDAHVHLFPDPMFEAIWKWFDTYGWPVRYKLKTPDTLEFLFSRGVSRVVALHYSHKPGMARAAQRVHGRRSPPRTRASSAWPPCCRASPARRTSSARPSPRACAA